MGIELILYDGALVHPEGIAGYDAIGFNASTSGGTAIDPGTTANTKGSWVPLTASTAVDYVGILVALDGTNQTAWSFQNWLVDLAIGASGSELIIVPNFFADAPGTSATTVNTIGSVQFLPIPIPAGTRIAARAQCSTNTATQRQLGITVYGAYQ
jgi:hypothetical protein